MQIGILHLKNQNGKGVNPDKMAHKVRSVWIHTICIGVCFSLHG